MTASRISVVLPVYNEADNIATCLRGLWNALENEEHEILVVYDFEEDTTLPAIEAMTDRPPSLRLVKNELGRGAANALRAGFAAATGDAVIVTMSDLSDPPELIPVMVERLREGADVVSGSRYMAGGSQTGGPLWKRCMAQTASLLMNGVAGLTTLDATSNFRGYSKRYLDEVEVESDLGFEIALELTVKAHLAGRTIAEVPSSWKDRSGGESQFRFWKWLPHYLRWFAHAMAAPAAAWILLLSLTLLGLARVATTEPAIAAAVALLFAAGGATVLVLARRLRGRTTWLDLLHPVIWFAPMLLGVAEGNVPFVLAGTASAALLAYGVGVGTLRQAARIGLARATDQRTLGVVAMGLLLWLSRIRWPKSTSGPALDASWEQAIGYALKNGFQWGADLVFTFGPLGYFNSGRYDPDLFFTKVLWWEIAFKGVLTVFLMLAVLRVRGPFVRTVAFLALLLPMHGHDAYMFLVIVAICAWLLERSDRSLVGTLPGLVPLSWIALIKFTPLVLAFASVGAIAVVYARRRSLPRGFGVVALFALSFCVSWMLLGQSLFNLPAYLSSSSVIAGAYSEAMAVFGPQSEVELAAGISCLVLIAALLATLERPRRIERVALAAIAVAGLYLAGKAGFVRHGNNAITFFTFAAVVPFMLPSARADASAALRVRLMTSIACALLGVAGYHMALEHGKHAPSRLFGDWSARIANNAGTLVDLEGERSKLDEVHERMKLVHGLPQIKQAVGDATVDLIHSRQGALFLNDLNWHPRPAFQGYFTYAPELLAANREFLESDDAPRFIVFHSKPIDLRVPNMDDHEAVLVMLRDYEPVLIENNYLLLERRQDAPRTSREIVIEERTLAFGEDYTLPPLEDAVHLLRVDVRSTSLGSVVTSLIKSPTVRMHVHRGRKESYRLIPDMARSGLILKPLPVRQAAWVNWFAGQREELPVERISITVGQSAENLFEPEVRVTLVRVEGIEQPSGDLRQPLDFSSFDPPPDEVSTPTSLRSRSAPGMDLVVVGAPSELRFDLHPGSYVLSGGFGLAPRSYRREPRTDGATFTACVVNGTGAETELWSHKLDPVSNKDDGELQSLELTFRADTASQLCLRTKPGPDGNDERDLAFWHQVSIVPAE
jgi:hypothetical protein